MGDGIIIWDFGWKFRVSGFSFGILMVEVWGDLGICKYLMWFLRGWFGDYGLRIIVKEYIINFIGIIMIILIVIRLFKKKDIVFKILV